MDHSSPSAPAPTRRRGASALEALPPDLLAAIAGLLGPKPKDRLSLAACSRRLLAASRQCCPSWWGRLHVELDFELELRGVQEWLAARRPAVSELHVRSYCFNARQDGFLLPDQPLPGLLDLDLTNFRLGSSQLLRVLQHTQLTRLQLADCAVEELPGCVAQLGDLQALGVGNTYSRQPLRGLDHLSSLRSLTSLHLDSYNTLEQVPASLSTLSALASLAIACGTHEADWKHLPTSLTSLDLRPSDSLAELPAALSRVTQLRKLDCSGCSCPRGGWQHMAGLPLTWLNLSGAILEAIPAVISTLTALEHLDLARNSLAGGLENLAGLTALTVLDLGSVGCALPSAFSTLGGLRDLTISFEAEGAVASLAHLSSLRQLTKLCWASDDVPDIPAAVAGMLQMQCLELADRRTDEAVRLPKGGWQHLSGLSQLTELAIGNCIGGVPAQLSSLAGLRRLEMLDSDCLAGGWQALEALSHLTALKLFFCDSGEEAAQQARPATDGARLTSLCQLDVSRCQLSTGGKPPGPASVELPFAAPSLTTFCLKTCSLQHMPAAMLSGMPALAELTLYGTLSAAEQRIPSLRQITSLDLGHCSLRKLPEGLSGCTALRSLSLAGNMLLGSSTQGAASLGQLASLQLLTSLVLYDCGLRTLPTALSCLTALRMLEVSGNVECASGHEHLAGLTCMVHLSSSSPLSHPAAHVASNRTVILS